MTQKLLNKGYLQHIFAKNINLPCKDDEIWLSVGVYNRSCLIYNIYISYFAYYLIAYWMSNSV